MTNRNLVYTIANTFSVFNFEVFLGNLSFVILFSLMILYWVEAVFFIVPKFNLVIFLLTLCANLTLFILLVIRWTTYNHFPLSNLYESLIFLSWSFTLIQLILIPFILNITKIPVSWKNKNGFSYLGSFGPKSGGPREPQKNSVNLPQTKKTITNINTLIGTIISPIALFLNSFATFSLPKTMQKAQALVPALQSNWLMMHVTVMLLSYTALLCGSLLAITFLIVTWYQSRKISKRESSVDFESNTQLYPATVTSFRTNKSANNITETNYSQSLGSFGPKSFRHPENEREPKIGSVDLSYTPMFALFSPTNQKIKMGISRSFNLPEDDLTRTLDNLSYRILGIGFPLLTIGILSGAVWANEAWGSYWSWDPKETWAFITWLVFAIYLHMRITKGWKGKKPAILATFGFFIVWICYLGVNILGTGLHSYGWLT
uniref:Cytochrome c biogenesis protein CcsA n=1 Tax=Prasiolopsis wulf-kochii TaxID=3239232 RepID=A0A097KJY8_9CHLO|nr:heme attachment to plastid cytochrome c [Prasiolopsis sp. SAG 84.81]